MNRQASSNSFSQKRKSVGCVQFDVVGMIVLKRYISTEKNLSRPKEKYATSAAQDYIEPTILLKMHSDNSDRQPKNEKSNLISIFKSLKLWFLKPTTSLKKEHLAARSTLIALIPVKAIAFGICKS